MELGTEQLIAILELLKEADVEEFEGLGFHVRFRDRGVQGSETVDLRQEEPKKIPTQWHHPALYPGGKPPSFPK